MSPKDTQRKSTRAARRTGASLCAMALCLGLLPGCGAEKVPPVIQGTQEEIVLDEDAALQSALLEGVSAVRGETDEAREEFPVQATVYTQTGEETQAPAAGTYRVVYTSEEGAEPVTSVLVLRPADRTAPVIDGAVDFSAEVGEAPSYRSGVTAVDNKDGEVPLRVDSSAVDLSRAGEYPVVYSAEDSHGNRAEVRVTLTVIDVVDVTAPPPEEPEQTPSESPSTQEKPKETQEPITEEKLHALADGILAKITNSGMSQHQKARAIYDYVRTHVTYVGTSDKSSWVIGAYIGFTRGRGDCFNYYACSKELLTRAGIPNVDLHRVGGTTDHYWQLVNTGSGYYHFDACPHPNHFPLASFMLTESEVRAYTKRCASVRKNYYVYDYDSCPVSVVWGSAEAPAPAPVEDPPAPAEEVPVEEAPTDEVPAEDVPAEEVPVEEVPVEEAPAEETPAEEVPVEELPPEALPEVPSPESAEPEEEMMIPVIDDTGETPQEPEVPEEPSPAEQSAQSPAPVETPAEPTPQTGENSAPVETAEAESAPAPEETAQAENPA